MRAFALITALLTLSTLLYGQSQLGLRQDNYAGINSVMLNPASSINTPYAFDINLAEGSHFSANNYAYLRSAGLLSLSKDGMYSKYIFQRDYAPPSPDDSVHTYYFDYYEGRRNRHFYTVNSIMGPSISFRINDNTRIGIMSRFRAVGSAHNVDEDFSYYVYHPRKFHKPFTVDPFQLAGAAWSEVGLHFSRSFTTLSGQWNLGFNARVLTGYEGGYFANRKPFIYTKLDPTEIGGEDFMLEAGFTDGLMYLETYQPGPNGRGWGLDLGAEYKFGEGPDNAYRWKLGLSILDIGHLTFDRQAQLHYFEQEDFADLDGDDYWRFMHLDSVRNIVRYFSEDVLGDSDMSSMPPIFSVGLPSALSLQMDYNFSPGWFVSGTYIGSLKLHRQTMARGQVLAVTPRYESYWYGFSMPVTWYQWTNVNVGMSMRLGPLTIGTHDLGSIFGNKRWSGAGIYGAVKLYPFQLDKNRHIKKDRRLRHKLNKLIKCFSF